MSDNLHIHIDCKIDIHNHNHGQSSDNEQLSESDQKAYDLLIKTASAFTKRLVRLDGRTASV